MKKADLHMHSIYSDGTDDIGTLIAAAANAGITVLSVTDHDNLGFYDNFDHKVPESMVIIPGIEFSCIAKGNKCHILGYGIDTRNSALRDVIAEGIRLRAEKLDKRLDFLLKKHGIILPEKDVAELKSLSSAGKPHIARCLIENGYAETVAEAIKKFLTGMPGEIDRVDAEFAVDAVVASGGIPVWAHPLGGEGEKRLEKSEFEKRLSLLKGYGIKGLECCYSRYSSDEITYLTEIAEKNGLLISGGSDYHGKNKEINPGMLGETENAYERLTILGILLK